MGRPIAPVPTNPIFIADSPLWLRGALDVAARASYDPDVRRARQAPTRAGGLILIALAAVSWGTSGSVMTLLAGAAPARPPPGGGARPWVAAIPLLLAPPAVGPSRPRGPG